MNAELVREPAVAGLFYPRDKRELELALDGYLEQAAGRGGRGGLPKALVLPHAGYVYSAPIAASGYALLAPHADGIRRVVLVGPAHRVYLDGLAAPGAARLRTPLGEMAVDQAALASVSGVGSSVEAHAREHSLEVHLPFLQRVAPNAKVVPLVVGRARPAEVARVLEALWGGPETVIVISSDLSHYLPYEAGRALDTKTVARIAELDEAPLDGEEACGSSGINGLAIVARARGLEGRVLDLRSSGDTAGDKDEVVGYGAIAFYEASAPRRNES